MATLIKYANSATPTGSWTSIENITDGTELTYASAYLNGYVVTGPSIIITFPACSSTELPVGTTINSVTVSLPYYMSGSYITIGLQPLKAGANIGTLTTNVVSYPTSRTILTAPAGTWTVADLTTTDYLQASVKTTRLWALSNATVFIDDLYYTIEYTTSSGITTQVNINGIWKDINCAVNIGGVWKPVTSIKKKIDGVWK